MRHAASKAIKISKPAKSKRERSSRACVVCRQRKVKCDAVERYPEKCTNCVQFNISQCCIPQPKRRQSKKLSKFLIEHELSGLVKNDNEKEGLSDTEDYANGKILQPSSSASDEFRAFNRTPSSGDTVFNGSAIIPDDLSILSALSGIVTSDPQDYLPQLSQIKLDPVRVLRRVFLSDPIPEYMGSTGPTPLIKQVIREYLDSNQKDGKQKSRIDATEFRQLCELGCFKLPEESLCRKYIQAYFEKIHWQQPVLDKKRFFNEYSDLHDPRSLVLLQSVLFAGSRVCEEPDWSDCDIHRQQKISYALHRRAQALYNAQLDQSALCLLQSVIIFGSYWDSDFISSKNNFFCYLKIAVCQAYSLGLHRSHASIAGLSEVDRKMFKRIWWTLFTKDCFYSFTFGRPWAIDLEKCDVELLTEDDMEMSNNENQLAHFIHRVKLAQVTRKVSDCMQKIRHRANHNLSSISLLEECDMLLTAWLKDLPPNLVFRIGHNDNNFCSATLAMEYYSILLVVHRCNIVRKPVANTKDDHNFSRKINFEYYPSWSITFKAAHIITLIGEYLLHHNYLPIYHSFVVYSMICAGVMMIYHLYNRDKIVSEMADCDIRVCLEVMKAAANKWPISKFSGFYLDTIYHNKSLQFTLIKDILDAANKETVTVKPDAQSMLILDDSFQPYRIDTEFLQGNPTLSAQRGTQLAKSSSRQLMTPAVLKSVPQKSVQVDSNRVTDVSVKSILYNAPNVSTADILLPVPGTSTEDSGSSNQSSKMHSLAGGGSSASSTKYVASTATFPDSFASSFPQSIGDNWLPSFDTSEFPNSPVPLQSSHDVVDDLFGYLGSTDMGMYS
ncbi:hypothetical protein FOA43_004650 [Brettanomyces nanus]|uniref:Zn(2)-C6 fungal-type domain-containing protein n=1 Tax=Eeniella nana TaxID=13502 RepID=A0A875S8N4_EENNA|nr:uncharacterized protein FOA43_004650 [Brettanomyces nanus]QPG77243.1 hypothetical protein FOA43_004650 [Brettanomyces nanus]